MKFLTLAFVINFITGLGQFLKGGNGKVVTWGMGSALHERTKQFFCHFTFFQQI